MAAAVRINGQVFSSMLHSEALALALETLAPDPRARRRLARSLDNGDIPLEFGWTHDDRFKPFTEEEDHEDRKRWYL
jgi:hypothetical protein